MLSAILSLVNGLLDFLSVILPDSPFQDLITGNDAILTGIGWLNWFVPVGDLLLIFGAYLAVLLLWVGVDWAMSSTGKVLGGLMGGGA